MPNDDVKRDEDMAGATLPASRPRRVLRLVPRLALVGAIAVAAVVGGSRWVIVSSAHERVYWRTSAVPHRRAALVLGAKVELSGAPSVSLRERVRAAVELYRAGRVDHLLMSGDHSRPDYDEPSTMRRLAMEAGVPAADITRDFAGFDTWDSCVRAKAVFGVTDPVLVTQGFHADRAVFLCRQAGLDPVALATPDEAIPGSVVPKLRAREWLAAPKAVFEGWTDDEPTYRGRFEGLGETDEAGR